MCPDRRRAGRTAFARLVAAMQSAFQEKLFVHHGRSGPVGRGIGDGFRMRAFAVPSEMGRGGGTCFSQFVRGLLAWYALITWNPDEGCGAFPVVYSLANGLGVMCATLNWLELQSL